MFKAINRNLKKYEVQSAYSILHVYFKNFLKRRFLLLLTNSHCAIAVGRL